MAHPESPRVPMASDHPTRGNSTLTIVASLVKFGMQALAMIAIARLIGPAEFGIIALTTVVAGIGELIRYSGANVIIIREPNLTVEQARGVHAVTTAVGLLATSIAVAVGIALQGSDGAPRGAYVAVSGACLLVAGFASVPGALLNRAGKYRQLATADVVATVLATSAGIGVAMWRGDAWALVTFVVTFNLALASLLLYKPGMSLLPHVPSVRAASGLMRGALETTLAQAFSYLGKAAIGIVALGRMGTLPTGLFLQAQQLSVAPLGVASGAVQRLALPALARAHLEQATARLVGSVLRGTALLFWPPVAVLVVVADPLVRLLLGSDWVGTIPLLRVLCISTAVQVVSYVFVWTTLAAGLTRVHLIWTATTQSGLLIATILTAAYGPTALAITLASAQCAITIGHLVLLARLELVEARLVISALKVPALTTSVVAVASLGFLRAVEASSLPDEPWIQLSMLVACLGLTAGTVVALSPKGSRRIFNSLRPDVATRSNTSHVDQI